MMLIKLSCQNEGICQDEDAASRQWRLAQPNRSAASRLKQQRRSGTLRNCAVGFTENWIYIVQKLGKRWLAGLLQRATGGSQPWERTFDQAASNDDILFCFRLLLGRLPNREEWRGHAMQAGEPLIGVVKSYLNSLEFSRRDLLKQEPLAGVTLAEFPEFSIYAAADDVAVGRHVLMNNYEPDVTRVFRRLLRRGMGVVDIGANIGYFSMLSAALVGETGYVLAIEPNAGNTLLLEASRRANGFAHVVVSQTAAGPNIGLLVLNRSYSNGTTSRISDDIFATTGSDIVSSVRPDILVPCDRSIDLIKADVEGAEYLALQGCTTIIERDHPIIISEFSPDLMKGISGIDARCYLAWLAEQGYSVSVIEPDGSLLPMRLGHDELMRVYNERGTDHVDIVAIPDRPIN